MANVFLSYARADLARARRVAEALEASDLTVFWDRDKLRPGQDLEQQINEQISIADAVVVLWSRDSIKSEAIISEARQALESNRIVPVFLDSGISPPDEFSHLQTESLADWDGNPKSMNFQRVFVGIRFLMGPEGFGAAAPKKPIVPEPMSHGAMLDELGRRSEGVEEFDVRPDQPKAASRGGWLGGLFSILSGASKSRGAGSTRDIQKDLVDCSVFCPFDVAAGREVLVQVFLHGQGEVEFNRAQSQARLMDSQAALQAQKTLDLEIARGTKVAVTLSTGNDEIEIDEAAQYLIWRGEPAFCQFVVYLPPYLVGEVVHPVVRIALDGQLIGRIVFTMYLSDQSESSDATLNGQVAQRYRHAFLSYATEDRKEVLKRAQALKASKISFFQDVLSLEPGQRWELELYKNIDKCDLFLLFWSSSAKDSEWVIKEAEYALEKFNDSEGATPDIVPIMLEGPPPVAPPEKLKAIHFNDPILYHLAASD